MMGDGKALQMGTSHELGQNFAKVVRHHLPGRRRCAADGVDHLVGGVDPHDGWPDHGSRRRRRAAGPASPGLDPGGGAVPSVTRTRGAGAQLSRISETLTDRGVRVRVDDRTDTSFGRRATDWELKGVPVRIEVGPRDLENGEVTLVRRDTNEKQQARLADLAVAVPGMLELIQAAMLADATRRRDDNTVDVATIDEARDAAQTGFARIPWATLGEAGEAVLAETAVTVRCLQLPDGSVPEAEDDPEVVAVVARAY
jgi:prolyl-tRNA synthetase